MICITNSQQQHTIKRILYISFWLCLIQIRQASFLPRRILLKNSFLHHNLEFRGGGKRNKKRRTTSSSSSSTTQSKKKPSLLSEAVTKYNSILPLTRVYLTMVMITTAVGVVLGEESQALLALDPHAVLKGLEVWRIFTAATFFGAPSIGWLMNIYYLFEYGSSLEKSFGTLQHLTFLVGELIFLSCLGFLLGVPFVSSSMITAMLHVLSRSMPNQKVKWLIFTVPYWTLPYGLMLADVLQTGSPMSSIPHVLGILSGHFYFFHKFIWPKLEGEDWWVAPELLTSLTTKSQTKIKKNKSRKGKKLGEG